MVLRVMEATGKLIKFWVLFEITPNITNSSNGQYIKDIYYISHDYKLMKGGDIGRKFRDQHTLFLSFYNLLYKRLENDICKDKNTRG